MLVLVLTLLASFTQVSGLALSSSDPPNVFPASTRTALANKSQQINVEQYSTAGWSNRAATALTPVCLEPAAVYTADRPFLWNGIDVSCRMTVIELPRKQLWIHSPVGLDGPLFKALDQLDATVAHVVSPNYEHLKFVPLWAKAFPNAKLWACPGLMERMPELDWAGEIPYGYRPVGFAGSSSDASADLPKDMWDTNMLQPLHIDVELNPFTGKPFFNEVVYFHVPTKTFMCTDLYWNYPASTVPNSQFGRDDSWELAPVVDKLPLGSRLWKVGMDKIFAPFYNKLMVQDETRYKQIANHIVNEWKPETVIPAHGDILRGEYFCRDVLTKHFGL